MSRIAKTPIRIPAGVNIKITDHNIIVQGKYGVLSQVIHNAIKIQHTQNSLFLSPYDEKKYVNSWALAGTMRALLNNMIIGVTYRFTKTLQLIGVGYRATITENIINLILGFSHAINYRLPNDIMAQCPNPTEIILIGINKQSIGQVAADLRSYRNPEPYKGKGICYANEIIHIKEAKKK